MDPAKLVAVVLTGGSLSGCVDYSTPYLTTQGALNEKLQRGEISKSQYEQELSRQRGTEPWGAPTPRPSERIY